MYYHATIYEMLGRRIGIFQKYLDPRTEKEKIEEAKKLRA
jgi:hypothetical protein